MSRGSECREGDEACAIYAVGEAINHITLNLMRDTPNTYSSYEQTRSAVTECMGFWLSDEFRKSKYYG